MGFISLAFLSVSTSIASAVIGHLLRYNRRYRVLIKLQPNGLFYELVFNGIPFKAGFFPCAPVFTVGHSTPDANGLYGNPLTIQPQAQKVFVVLSSE